MACLYLLGGEVLKAEFSSIAKARDSASGQLTFRFVLEEIFKPLSQPKLTVYAFISLNLVRSKKAQQVLMTANLLKCLEGLVAAFRLVLQVMRVNNETTHVRIVAFDQLADAWPFISHISHFNFQKGFSFEKALSRNNVLSTSVPTSGLKADAFSRWKILCGP